MTVETAIEERKLSVYVAPGVEAPEKPKKITVEDSYILEVRMEYGLTLDEINMKSNKREIVEARQVAHTVLKLGTKLSFSKIGFMVGGKDHATAMHSVRTISDLFQTNKDFRERIDGILIKTGLYSKRNILLEPKKSKTKKRKRCQNHRQK